MSYPLIIQGGMGVAISSWQLARKVSQRGQLGVVSGTGIDTIMTRRLQLGDEGGHIRRAFDHFPFPEIAERVWERYYIPGGKAPDAPFKSKPIPNLPLPKAMTEMVILANFVEVWLAKEGHRGVVGVNLLEKIQIPTLPSLFGAMLAEVDYIIMGAGIPREIPGILNRFACGHPAELDIAVIDSGSDESSEARPQLKATFDPAEYGAPELKRPKFLAIVSTTLLATVLAKKSPVPPDGFIIEGDTAGGHNAPPRGEMRLNERGEPIYTEKDVPDLNRIKELGLPFWLAGSWALRLQEARAAGAEGVQVGTAFAFCNESGMRPDLRDRIIRRSLAGEVGVFTSPVASPTGFPFKVVLDEGSLSNPAVYAKRGRICDLSYLRSPYWKENGKLGYRCASEPLDDFDDKGDKEAETEGRMCLCNGLLATAGMPQVRDGVVEDYVITAGDDVVNLRRYLKEGEFSYSADDVVDLLLAGVEPALAER